MTLDGGGLLPQLNVARLPVPASKSQFRSFKIENDNESLGPGRREEVIRVRPEKASRRFNGDVELALRPGYVRLLR